MGNIIDIISQRIKFQDVAHDWDDRYGHLDWEEEKENQIQAPFEQEGLSIIKQNEKNGKGIRYGGPSTLDNRYSITNSLGIMLTGANRQKVMELNNKTAERVFFNQSSENKACGALLGGSSGNFNGDLWTGTFEAEWLRGTDLDIHHNSILLPENLKIIETVNKYAPKYGMPPLFIMALIRTEYGWFGEVSTKGANGIGQFMSITWPDVASRVKKKWPELSNYNSSYPSGAHDKVFGTVCSIDYIYECHQSMNRTYPGQDNDFYLARAGYNRGINAASRTIKQHYSNGIVNRTTLFPALPKETQNYINNIDKRYLEYSKKVPRSQVAKEQGALSDSENGTLI